MSSENYLFLIYISIAKAMFYDLLITQRYIFQQCFVNVISYICVSCGVDCVSLCSVLHVDPSMLWWCVIYVVA